MFYLIYNRDVNDFQAAVAAAEERGDTCQGGVAVNTTLETVTLPNDSVVQQYVTTWYQAMHGTPLP